LGLYKAGSSPAWKDSTLIPREVDSLRSKANVQGAIYFSSTSFNRNPNGWSDSIRNYYSTPALIPPMDWLPKKPEKTSSE
jgi:hypothetical protein